MARRNVRREIKGRIYFLATSEAEKAQSEETVPFSVQSVFAKTTSLIAVAFQAVE